MQDVLSLLYDGAECCELVGLYLLKGMLNIVDRSEGGLYRDDGLLAVRGRGRAIDKKRKELIKFFQQEGLNITAEANLIKVDFLDVSLNLQDGSYRPYTKPNADIKYVSTLSNHPPSVLQNIPDSISKRLHSISSNAECFNEEKAIYQKALTEAHHDYHLEYNG